MAQIAVQAVGVDDGEAFNVTVSPAATAKLCEVSAPVVSESDIVIVIPVATSFFKTANVQLLPDPGAAERRTLKFLKSPDVGIKLRA
jgi:hypothetical protein